MQHRWKYGIAVAANVGLVLAAAFSGKDSAAELIVALVSASSQAWIAFILYQLNNKQYAFSKMSAEVQLRAALFPQRLALLGRFPTASGINLCDYDDVKTKALFAYWLEVRALFTNETVAEARKMAEASKAVKATIAGTDERRTAVSRFQAARKACLLKLREETWVSSDVMNDGDTADDLDI